MEPLNFNFLQGHSDHYMEMAFRLADVCYVMDHGEIVLHDYIENLKGEDVQKHISI